MTDSEVSPLAYITDRVDDDDDDDEDGLDILAPDAAQWAGNYGNATFVNQGGGTSKLGGAGNGDVETQRQQTKEMTRTSSVEAPSRSHSSLRSKPMSLQRLHEARDRAKVKALWAQARCHAVRAVKVGRLQTPWQKKLQQILQHPLWEHLVIALVLTTCVCIALETDLCIEEWPMMITVVSVIESFVGLFFCTEGILKVAAFGWHRVISSRAHMYEFLIALLGAVDLFVIDFGNKTAGRAGLNVLPCLRAARLTFVLQTGELGVITRCFFPAFGTLVHVSIFLILIIFIYSVPLVRMVGTNPLWDDSPEVADLFGTLPRATFGLLQMMIDPDTALMQKLFERQWWTAPFFLSYVLMTTHSLMSIIVSAMSENYQVFANVERNRQGQAERDRQARIRHRMLLQLKAADAMEPGLEGSLSHTAFSEKLQGWGFQRALQDLKVDSATVQELLNLLEVEGHVYYEEFIDALGSLHLSVTPTDLLVLRARLLEEIKGIEQRMFERFDEHFSKQLVDVESRLTSRIDSGFAALAAGLKK